MLGSPYQRSGDVPFTLGILGGGQLAKMLAQSAYQLGLRVAIIEHGADSPAGIMTKLEFSGGWNSDVDLELFISASDTITLENEFIDPKIVERIAEKRLVFPTAQTLEKIQDKYIQKQTFRSCGIPTTEFISLDSPEDAIEFGTKHGFPFIIKTRTLGYDGYGNATVRNSNDIHSVWRKFTESEEPRALMAEKFVHFTKELAVMVARNRRGEVAVYPCVETIQENHICRAVIAPAQVEKHLQLRAKEIALECVKAIDGVGMFGIELFLTNDGDILFNEIAPRPHNSGHYTIEACVTSQFENAVRAVCNLPLGSPEMIAPAAVMINILGERSGSAIPDSVVETLKIPTASLHLYGKSTSRKGRKMGHITALGSTSDEAMQSALNSAKSLIW
ncbi:MAG: 5-(carboxyamino)imidazole ribonucleotide synthase [Ignavibacteria bacterium]|nr:5-(carboxyamino)imidazole ribonucleotide synthase [Ignavibacteria bacterium]